MNLPENCNQQSELVGQNLKCELNEKKEKKEKEDEYLSMETVKKETNNNEFESSNYENKFKIFVNNNEEPKIESSSNINLNENEATTENNKSKTANHEIIPECINNCINWTLRAHLIKKNHDHK